jgi:hypothetical protein
MTDENKPLDNKVEATTQPETAPQKQIDAASEPSLGRRALRWIFRMLVVIMLGIALGAGIYYGVRSFYRDAIEPLQTLDQRMRDSEAGMFELKEIVREDKKTVTEEMADLRGNLALQAEKLASLAAQVERLELQTEDQDDVLAELVDLRETLDQIDQDQASTEEKLETLEELIEAGELPAERVQSTLQLIRVMNLLTRARLWIEQNNFGLASDDIEASLEILEELSTVDESDERLLEIIDRLTLALETTTTESTLAEEELEIVWKLLIEATAP